METQAMTWISVVSDALEAISYDAASYTLGVMTKATPTKAGTPTKTGTPYFYINVPPEVHQKMMLEKSKGKFWLQVIKPTYECRKSDNTLAQQSPKADPLNPKVGRVITETAAIAPKPPAPEPEPVAEILALSIATSGGITSLEDLVERLREQMDWHCMDLVIEIDDLAKRALATIVIDEASYKSAADLGKQLADKRRFVTNKLMKPTKQSIDSVKAVVLDKENNLLASIEAGEDRLDKLCTAYRVTENKRAQEAADAERQQKLREAEDKRIAEAEKAQESGRTGLAEKLLSTPVTAPKVQVEAAVPKVSGVSGGITYKWRVKDESAVPRHWLMLNESLIGEFARKSKLADGTVLDGIEFIQVHKTDF